MLADSRGASIANLATCWVLDRPRVAAAIVGARDGSHLEENLALFRIAVDERFREEIEGALGAWPGPQGPVFGLERVPGGRHSVIMKTELNRSER
jgi:aryl-alcohol dehydrogenase-like predicted oxidoreductase